VTERDPLPEAIEMSWRDRAMFLRGRITMLGEVVEAAADFGRASPDWQGYMERLEVMRAEILDEQTLLAAEAQE
jgi:hypothetical protein